MYPAVIEDYVAPTTIDAALQALADHGEGAHFIAGGQSLMQAVKARLIQPTCLVDLQNVAELKGITIDGNGVRIGAMTRYREVAADEQLNGAYQALRDAASHVGDRQVRNRGTVGGSLCWNFIAACTPPTAIGIGAELELVARDGTRRTVAAEDFLGSPLETDLRDDELLAAITLPAVPTNAGSAYQKWGLLTDSLPVIGVCVSLQTDNSGTISSARFAVGGLESGPRRSPAAEAGLVGKSAADADGIRAASAAAAEEIEVQGDMWADPDYRKHLIGSLGADVTTIALARAAGGL